jgi:hypothetical protein
LIGYDTDVNTYKEGTLRLSLVDSETKNIVWKGTASNSIFKSQNESKAIANLWMICSRNTPKSLIQMTSSSEIIDSLNEIQN